MTDVINVLLVEDDANIREITLLALRLEPAFVVRSCASGFDAMKIMLSGQTHIDLILLDMTLPDSTGLELINELNADPDLIAPPVIFFTGALQPREILSYVNAGAIGVIAKPFDPVTLAAEVKRAFCNR